MLGIGLYIAILAFLTLLTLRKPQFALVGVLCMFGLEQLGQVYSALLRSHGIFTNLYIMLLMAAALPVAYFSGRFGLRLNPAHSKIRMLSLGLFLFAFMSLVWAPGQAWVYWATVWPYLIANIVLAPLLIGRVTDLEEAQRAFIWMGGILVLFLATVPDWGIRSLLISGSAEEMGKPLALAQLSGYLVIMAVVHFKKDYLSIGWLAVVAIAALVVAIRTGSRGQLVFSILSLILVLPIAWPRFSVKHALQLALVGVFVVAVGLYLMIAMEAYDRWGPGKILTDLNDRFDLAMILLEAWINSTRAVIFGLGNSASFSSDLMGIYPHIVPLEVLGEEGVIGFLLFMMIIILSFRQANRIRRSSLPAEIRRVYAANFGCLIFTLLLSLKQGSLITSPAIFLFAVIGEKYFYLIKKSYASSSRKSLTRASQVKVA